MMTHKMFNTIPGTERIHSFNKHLLSTYTVSDEKHLINLLSINKYGNSAMMSCEHIITRLYLNQESLP